MAERNGPSVRRLVKRNAPSPEIVAARVAKRLFTPEGDDTVTPLAAGYFHMRALPRRKHPVRLRGTK